MGSDGFDLVNNVHTINDLSKDSVLSVQPWGIGGADEELRSVGVGSGVGHGQDSGTGVSELEVLVGELVSVDGLSSSSVMVCEVPPLALSKKRQNISPIIML